MSKGDYMMQNIFLISCFIPLCLYCHEDLFDVKKAYLRYDDRVKKTGVSNLFGLQVEEFMSKNDFKAAQNLLLKNLLNKNAPREAIYFRLAFIANKQQKFHDFKKYFELSETLGILNNSAIIGKIYKSLPIPEKTWLINRLLRSNFFASSLSKCPYFELEQRKKRGELLYLINNEHHLPYKIKKQIFYELYVEKPEVIDFSQLRKNKNFNKFFKRIEYSDVAKRMELLLVLGKNTDARNTFNDSKILQKKMSGAEICALTYLDIKVDRQLKNYATARERLLSLGPECDQETIRKGRYLSLLLASQMQDEKSLEKFDSFVKDYPTHSFADDILLFKANLLLGRKRLEEGQNVLKKLIKLYPSGDMIQRARFLLAFMWAKKGQPEDAIKILDQIKTTSNPLSIDYASAAYWQARLSIFNDLSVLNKPNVEQIKLKKPLLLELIYSPFPTVYSWLALEILNASGEKLEKKPKIFSDSNKSELNIKINNEKLSRIQTLIMSGFRTESLNLLEEIPVDENRGDQAIAMAVFYDVLNRPEAAHQKLIRCDANISALLAERVPNIFNRISYPRPYKLQVEKTLKHIDIPKSLIFAIMRQESGFINLANSFANAKGLMQLIHSSAIAQGKFLGLNDIRKEDLFLPRFNILLGSSLLQRYWQKLGHIAIGIAAYNAGPTMAKVWLTRNKFAPIDTFLENISFKDTRAYVKSVLGATFAYAVACGFSLPNLMN
jgi:tetratricopeptide (TPR) repeat protein